MQIRSGGTQNFQMMIDLANLAKSRTVSAEQGRVAAQNSGLISEKSGEIFSPSGNAEATLLREKLALSEDLEQARQGLADEANRTHHESKAKEKDRKLRDPQIRSMPKSEKRVFLLDDESEEPYEVTPNQGIRVDELDRQTAESILDGMPESTRAAASATLKSQLETRGADKIAELRDDPKVSAQVEEMDLELADTEWRHNTLAPIRTPFSHPPLQLDDPYAEQMAMAVAVSYMQSEQEQIVA